MGIQHGDILNISGSRKTIWSIPEEFWGIFREIKYGNSMQHSQVTQRMYKNGKNAVTPNYDEEIWSDIKIGVAQVSFPYCWWSRWWTKWLYRDDGTNVEVSGAPTRGGQTELMPWPTWRCWMSRCNDWNTRDDARYLCVVYFVATS